MLYIVAACVAISVAFAVLFVLQIEPAAHGRRPGGWTSWSRAGTARWSSSARRRRLEQSERLKEMLQLWGEKVEQTRPDNETVRLFLIQAGYMTSELGRVLLGRPAAAGRRAARRSACCSCRCSGKSPLFSTMPALLARRRWAGSSRRSTSATGSSTRQKEIVKALPDALDMMVVCVEAGLGLNQALVRVSEEIVHVEPGHERAARAGEPGDPGRHAAGRGACATWASAPA